MTIGKIDFDRSPAVDDRSAYPESGFSAAKAARFELAMEQAGRKKASVQLSRELVTTQAELLRLQMMRDAISLGGDQPPVQNSFSSQVTAQLAQGLATYRGNADTSEPEPSTRSVQPQEAALTPAQGNSGQSPDSGPIKDIIQRASTRYGIEPGLIRAVIKAESNFNPKAVSGAGARGLMQLMPGTARDLGVTNAFDPEQNVMAGTRYLRKMLDRYDGNLDSALAAYNWGPGNVDRKGRALPSETRSYLARVKDLYNSYSG